MESVKSETSDLSFKAALNKLGAQLQFCKVAKERFSKIYSEDSTAFYAGKILDLQWQIVQLQEHFDTTGAVLPLKREAISVPVVNVNERLSEEDLELNTSDIFFNPVTNSKKLYFLRYVICLPLQKTVLQEQKTILFKTDEVEKVESKRLFSYPRNDLKMCDSLKRGYLTVELYAEKKLKAPTLVGLPQRIPLEPLLHELSIKGMLTFGDKGEWDISYAVNIRRPHLREEKDNFEMVQKEWICLTSDVPKITRRASVATMQANPLDSHHHGNHHHSSRKRRNNRNHRHRHGHEKILEDQTEGLSIITTSGSESNDSLHSMKKGQLGEQKDDQKANQKQSNGEIGPLCEPLKECSLDGLSNQKVEKLEPNKNASGTKRKTLTRRFTDFF